ncbi:hypothetical protein ACMXZI_07820 [Bacillus subtilis]|jgi:hypothetical protein|uniref:Uncharacterized protein n=2 Tax=Bacillus subtilis TaxID=1423 RepID=A0A8I2B7Y3_BACIU|nr:MULTISPECIES: hypothetical protein [Bacillus]AIX07548.1 hypothetical protein OB04_01888 [Bacillus subtilis]ARB37164.1 hypothetical protein BSK2_09480 [Bacillus subtilis]ASZ61521.1 hypothetical protein CLD04_10200 [Bacillus subtilis]KAF2426816.1 hypothetical protein B6K89_05140 [Bacillus subtilis]MBE0187343.1 hypothetical protein [Bacillus subtilis]
MKKVFCKLAISSIALFTLSLPNGNVLAAEKGEEKPVSIKGVESQVHTVFANETTGVKSNLGGGEFTAQFVNDFRNVKMNVKTYKSWSSFKRVSDNIATGSKGGSITANKTVTFTTTVSGSISGLGISTAGSVASSKGYTLNVGANKRVYMAYRVRYNVEEGYNCRKDIVTGKCVSKKKYVVKKPMYGEYALKNY